MRVPNYGRSVSLGSGLAIGALAATFSPRVDGWRLPRRVRAGAIVGGVVVVAAAAVGTRGFG